MFKLIKYLLIGVPVVIIAIIAVLFFSVNSIIKQGVETVGPMALGTEVNQKKVNISLFSLRSIMQMKKTLRFYGLS